MAKKQKITKPKNIINIDNEIKDKLIAALKVLMLTPHIRRYLEFYDPEALAQAEEALKDLPKSDAEQFAEAAERGI